MRDPWPRKTILAVSAGFVGGLGTQVLLKLIDLFRHWLQQDLAGYKPPLLPSEHGTTANLVGPHGMWLMPVSVVLGALISGLLIDFVARESKGHGTDKAIRSFHELGGHTRPIVPANSLLSAAALIGSGACAGREGPIISISGGTVSAVADLFKRPAPEVRLLLLSGMAAGLAAIYRAPIGAAIFAMEGLYSGLDLEAAALPWVFIASVVAWLTNAAFWGFTPLFVVPAAPYPHIFSYLYLVGLGLLCGLVASVHPWFFYRVRDGFNKIPLPLWVKPAIGAAILGGIGLAFPQILNSGYGWMQLALTNHLVLGVLIPMIGLKMLGMALSVGTGGTGGVFAPTLFMGAMLGGAFARLAHLGPAEVWVLAGMAAMFGAACRCPFTALVILPEMTGDWKLMPAVAVAVWAALLLQQRLTRNFEHQSLYEEQVPTRRESGAHRMGPSVG